MSDSIRFGLLGPIVVRDGEGVLINVTGREARALALLMLKAGKPVSADRLIRATWHDEQPASPESAIHNVMYRLRRFLDGSGLSDVIAKGPGGYTLLVDPSLIDSHQFEWLVSEASQQDRCEARDLMAAALDLWRGEIFEGAGVASRYLDAEARRLSALRWIALETRIGCDLADGKYREVIPELLGLTTAVPLRENLWAYLMAARYFSGNQGGALLAYRRLRGILTTEYGIEPSHSLRELEEAILAQDDERVRFLSIGDLIAQDPQYS